MKTLIIDGQFNLKRNFFKYGSVENNNKYRCGAIIGFIVSIQKTISKVVPDRVIVVWEGFNSGKLRYEIHKPYKVFKLKEWSKEINMIENEGVTSDSKEKNEFDLLIQKIELKNILNELCIHQIEVDYTEVKDIIAGYILQSKNEERNENIIIFGSSEDFNQLIDHNISLVYPKNYDIVSLQNFKEKNGYIIDNELLFRCFEGNKSDGVDGVNGLTKKKLIKFFPDMVDRKYTYKDLFDKSWILVNTEKKKQKFYKKILESKIILYRNLELMNLKKPFLSDEAIEEIEQLNNTSFEVKDINNTIIELTKEGYIDILRNNGFNTKTFFSVFYTLLNKEKKLF